MQFKTEDDDSAMPLYQEGDVVPDLVAGEYDGIGQCLCHPCVNRWLEARRLACLEELVRAEEKKEIIVADWPSQWANGLYSALPPRRTEWPQGTICSPYWVLGDCLKLSSRDLQLLQQRTEQQLLELGWPIEMNQDFPVAVDESHRVSVIRAVGN